MCRFYFNMLFETSFLLNLCRFLPVFSIKKYPQYRSRCWLGWACCPIPTIHRFAPRFARPPTPLRYSQLRTKQPSRAKTNTATTTKKEKKERKKNILNHPFCKLILNYPFYKIILNHPFFFFRGLRYSLDFF